MPTISKSRFVSGNQCDKKLFFDVYRKELKPIVSENQQALFNTGHVLGKSAQQVFPEGIDATEEINGDWSIAIDRTRQWLTSGIYTIYEATFSIPGGFAALDILHQKNEERWAIEVKSSTSVQQYHIVDASFQYYVMSKAGFAPDKFFLMHINNRFIKNGPVQPKEMFHLEDITLKVLENQGFVEQKLQGLLKMLDANIEPIREIGKHCYAPFACDYIHHCWAHLPENSVFNLNNARGKDWKLYEQGVLSLSDVPEDFPLNHRQELQIKGIKYNEQYFNHDRIKDFLSRLEGPLHFFDFETINPAFPVLDGTRPFEQVPFQYSLHVTDIDGNILEHHEFLADPEDFSNCNKPDPRLQLIEKLRRDIGDTGAIVAYNASFEISILNSLSTAFKDHREFIDSLISRFVDLLTPFKSGWYYLPAMGSSASIKSVLPAIAPEFSYADLEIGNGGLASSTFHSMIEDCFTGDLNIVKNHMLKYCERDTEGMVVIYRHLRQLLKGDSQ